MKPYAVAAGEGRTYVWRDIVFTIKAAAAETGGAVAIREVTTRPEKSLILIRTKRMRSSTSFRAPLTFHCEGRDFKVNEGGFMLLARGIPHSYTIERKEVRLFGLSTPSGFGDHIERTGKPVHHH